MISTQDFLSQLQAYEDRFRSALSTEAGDWVIKGFIDVHQNIYTISVDTKVISKIIELMLFPIFQEFAYQHQYQLVLAEHQNHYPDITFITNDHTKIALDFKSTYRINSHTVSGFTLGSFTGYFRQRQSLKNITFAYDDYQAHLVFGTLYSRTQHDIDESQIYTLDHLHDIRSVATDFDFILQEKWRIAHDKPGSGNTKNIGSSRNIQKLLHGQGIFASHSKKIFDDYWMHYLTADMAKAIDSVIPYTNLDEYLIWRNNLLTDASDSSLDSRC